LKRGRKRWHGLFNIRLGRLRKTVKELDEYTQLKLLRKTHYTAKKQQNKEGKRAQEHSPKIRKVS
jgi:hypothetical protein